ncbi:MAG: ECF transporter S component [Thermosphaera aggregans]|jgi:energy-coupling factor transport system substrate-specific component|uniref:ECF transporter S component n=1 Tax=Thermosphaera aggregans TaxID=54254 RepID=UPI003C03E2EC
MTAPKSSGAGKTYTVVDFLYLGVIAVVFAVLFTLWWDVYYAVKAILGPVGTRILTYGLWFMPIPLAASLIRKPFAGLLGEVLPALLEAIFPTPGGIYNLYYGIAQGLAGEAGYAVFRYRKYGAVQAAVSGALPAIPALILDAVLFEDIYPWNEMVVLLAALMISGVMYGLIAYNASLSIRRK